MQNAKTLLFFGITGIFFFLIFFSGVHADENQKRETKAYEWRGYWSNETPMTEKDLKEILKKHFAWLEKWPYGRRADLRGARLQFVNLREAKLNEANLSEANLAGADLRGADLKRADLSGATLVRSRRRWGDGNVLKKNADLSEANLDGAWLNKAHLDGANLSHASMVDASLCETNLSGVDLSGADLKRADLSDADLKRVKAISTDFAYCRFEPSNIENLVFIGAKGLKSLRFNDPSQTVQLRKMARESGLRSHERELTAALRKYRLDEGAKWSVRYIEFPFIDFSTDYGANPWRSFLFLGFFIVLFSIYYIITLMRGGKDGIWRLWIKERVRQYLWDERPTRLRLKGFTAIRWGIYFSILSAFNIGWRDLNVGNWINRIQRREYVLRATGWTRTVSGIQSLISVYLLALWALTYFGRPFE